MRADRPPHFRPQCPFARYATSSYHLRSGTIVPANASNAGASRRRNELEWRCDTSNNAALPGLSGVSTCALPPQTALVCFTACPSEVASGEGLVEQFCAAVAPSSSGSGSAPLFGDGHGSTSSTSGSFTAPPTSSNASTSPNAASAMRVRMKGRGGIAECPGLGASVLGVPLGAMVVL
ncbi:hypothetical protein MSAN_01825100 [Mycena sanguinolenta]|uniref:Uncharacterized protein n=1 Tax=Mycena sanguinolenta TaxID=230812 RepID=A0A8H7CSR1_9AGAR|nr:hypothetical protein MSAN_01825100 [Mycena sanguinolenta]